MRAYACEVLSSVLARWSSKHTECRALLKNSEVVLFSSELQKTTSEVEELSKAVRIWSAPVSGQAPKEVSPFSRYHIEKMVKTQEADR